MESSFAVEVNGGHGFARRHTVSYFLMQDDADCRIHRVFLALASATEDDACCPNLFAIHSRQETAFRGGNVFSLARLREAFRIVKRSAISTLQFHHLPEFLESSSRRNQFRTLLCPLRNRLRKSSQMQHPTGQVQAEFFQIFRTLSSQNLQHLYHLKRIPNHVAQRLIHVGDERD